MQNKEPEYKDLYKNILEIGKSKINNGVSYYDLCQILKTKGFEINGCSTLAIKKFFCDNFYHIPTEDKPEPTPKNLSQQHCKCNFVMKGEACLYLERLNELEELKRSNKISKLLAWSAIIIGVLSAFGGNYPDWEDYFNKKSQNKSNKEQLKDSKLNNPTIKHQQLNVEQIEKNNLSFDTFHNVQITPTKKLQNPILTKDQKTIPSVSPK